MAVIEATQQATPVAEPRLRWRALLRHRIGVLGAAMLLFAIVVAIFAPWIAPYDPYAPVDVTIFDIYQPPSPAHPLGTDDGGKDVFSSLVYGARVSLVVGFTAAAIAIGIGALVGIVAGYRRGWLGSLLMRITDFFLVIPDLALMIVLVAIIGPSLGTIILVIGFLGWTGTARLIRAQTLSVRERKYVMRAQAVGAGDAHILRRHILPAVLPLMLANLVLVVSIAILEESSLAFLGLGDPTVISWGQMLNYAFERGAISAGAWWALLSPGFAIVWVVLGTTLLGFALENVVNPRLRRHHLEDPGTDVAPERQISPSARGRARRRGADPPRPRPGHRVRRRVRAAARRRRGQLRPAPRRDAGPRRRVGLRQDDHRPRPAPPAAARRPDRRRLGLVRRRGPRRARRPRPALVPLDPPLARLPGRDERAQPRADGGGPDLRGDPAPRAGDVEGGGRGAHRPSSSSASGSRGVGPASTRTRTPVGCASGR